MICSPLATTIKFFRLLVRRNNPVGFWVVRWVSRSDTAALKGWNEYIGYGVQKGSSMLHTFQLKNKKMGKSLAVHIGNRFRCTQTIIGENLRGCECEFFIKGYHYQSDNDGCITDECGNMYHEITSSFGGKYFEEIIEKII